MFAWLVGLCRDTPFFNPESSEALVAAMNDADDLLAIGTPEATQQAMEKESDLLQLALGDDAQEPLFEILTPELMDALDKVYERQFRKGIDSGDTGVWELTFSTKLPPGFTIEEIEEKQRKYYTKVLDVLDKHYKGIKDDASVPEKSRRLFGQMYGKLSVLTQWSAMGSREMPMMPILTRSVVQMLVRRLEGVRDAIEEVSKSTIYEVKSARNAIEFNVRSSLAHMPLVQVCMSGNHVHHLHMVSYCIMQPLCPIIGR